MACSRGLGFALVGLGAIAFVPATAAAETVCGTVEEFNTAMADAGTSAEDVTLTFDVVGVNPNDFFGTKGSLAQMRNTTCGTGQDATIKVYGPDDPPNEAHPTGTLKLEYGNSCCGGECGEHWADPNASAPIFVDGTEQCNVTMWINPAEVGYSLACNVGQFDALGENALQNRVDQIAVLEYFLADGGTTWELPNATASNVEVCWEAVPSDQQSITVPVRQDVTAGPSWPDTVFPDVTDLAVEAGDGVAFLEFEVPPIDGKITRTRLFMHTSTAPSSDGDGGEVHLLTEGGWSEATMTWNTHPAYEPASLGRIGPGAADILLSLDLGPVVDAPGIWGFAVVSPPGDGNGTHFWSKEGSPADAAYLKIDIVVMDVDGDGTPDGPDCDDADPAVGPGAEELCNGVDDDCDGETDEGCETGTDGSDDGGLGSDGSGSGDDAGGIPSPGAGQRGAETACGCTSSSDTRQVWLVVVAFMLARRRRRRPLRNAGEHRR